MGSIQLKTEIPGPKSQALVARREAATPQGAAKLTGVAIERAEGAILTDVDGNQLLDFAGGIGVLAVGHCPPTVVNAIQAQTEKMIHLCAIVGTYEPYVEFAEMLNTVAPGNTPKKTVLLNSGAESVETAVKIARSYTGRGGIIVFEGGYHGRTNMTLAMTSKYGLFKKGFGPITPETMIDHEQYFRLDLITVVKRLIPCCAVATIVKQAKSLRTVFIVKFWQSFTTGPDRIRLLNAFLKTFGISIPVIRHHGRPAVWNQFMHCHVPKCQYAVTSKAIARIN